MPQGLQIWDAEGRLSVDLSDRLSRYIGSVVTGTSDNSIQVPDFSLGTGWFTVLEDGLQIFGKPPNVFISGTTLSWTFPTNVAANPQSVTIIYGVW